ncbi:MAG: hypothetical protein QOF66_4652 [Mycobacterium sp.]|jgi:hypothetical protein|nr:hypothetical protein [Mycobacterium sp.]MDT5230292.1 hypothetical protein [Mycobacterium sp.]MDT5318586.1 hypothetical protein [Mycobacterium sp.]
MVEVFASPTTRRWGDSRLRPRGSSNSVVVQQCNVKRRSPDAH